MLAALRGHLGEPSAQSSQETQQRDSPRAGGEVRRRVEQDRWRRIAPFQATASRLGAPSSGPVRVPHHRAERIVDAEHPELTDLGRECVHQRSDGLDRGDARASREIDVHPFDAGTHQRGHPRRRGEHAEAGEAQHLAALFIRTLVQRLTAVRAQGVDNAGKPQAADFAGWRQRELRRPAALIVVGRGLQIEMKRPTVGSFQHEGAHGRRADGPRGCLIGSRRLGLPPRQARESAPERVRLEVLRRDRRLQGGQELHEFAVAQRQPSGRKCRRPFRPARQEQSDLVPDRSIHQTGRHGRHQGARIVVSLRGPVRFAGEGLAQRFPIVVTPVQTRVQGGHVR